MAGVESRTPGDAFAIVSRERIDFCVCHFMCAQCLVKEAGYQSLVQGC